MDLVNYQTEVSIRLSAAWESARVAIRKAQKKCHDRQAKDPKISVGENVFVYFPAKKSGKAYKFARPFQGPYIVQRVQLKKVGHPRAKPLQVSLNRVRRCPKELVGEQTGEGSSVTASEQVPSQRSSDITDAFECEDLSENQESELLLNQDVDNNPDQDPEDSPDQCNAWSGRLRSRQRVELQS